MNLLLTGAPGSGKTTLIQRSLERYDGRAGGFTTQEIRIDGARAGFEIRTLDGGYGVLAHIHQASLVQVGKYGVDLGVVENLAVPAVLQAVEQGWLVVIDEIGPMEMRSQAFCRAVGVALDSESRVLGTIVKRGDALVEQIKQRPDVRLLEVTRANRDARVDAILEWVERA